jgi:phospholipase/carboxylesterase
MTSNDPHRDEPILSAGSGLDNASGAVVLLHGRGASAEDILGLAQAMYHPQLAYLAPAAAGHTWYPNSFLAPRAQNEPWLSSALEKVGATVQLAVDSGIATDRIVICGFSQGACLSTEFVATHPARYAGLIAFTGGLIGPPDADLAHIGDLQETPAFFGSGDPDPHVPWARVQQSADVLTSMNARITIRRYPGRPHTINAEEIDFGRRLITEAFGVPHAG